MPVVALVAAPGAAAARTPRCSPDRAFGRAPTTIADPLDPALLAQYAILRRVGTAVDQPPPINSLGEQLDFGLRYNPLYLRQLTQRPGGRRFFVAPGFPRAMPVPPTRCLPPSLRAQRPRLVEEELKREREPLACVVTYSPNEPSVDSVISYGGESCPRFRDVTKYEYLTSGLLSGNEQAGILPDGIAAVRVHFQRAPTVQVAVAENFYLYRSDPARRRALFRRLHQLALRLYGPHSPRSRADRRKLRHAIATLTERALLEFTPTRVDLLAADGHVLKVAKRPKRRAGLVPFA